MACMYGTLTAMFLGVMIHNNFALDTAYGITDSFSDIGPAIGAALTVGIPIMGSVLVLVYRYHKLRIPISEAFTYKKQEVDTNVPIVKVTFPEHGMEHHIFQEHIYEALLQRDQDDHMYSLLSPGLGNSDEIRTDSVHDDILRKTQAASHNNLRSPSAKPTNRKTLYIEAVTRFLTGDDNDYVHLQDETTYL